MKFCFYDTEVFLCDWMLVACTEDTETKEMFKYVIANNRDELERFYIEHLDYIWVGYNSRHYDIYIIQAILSGEEPYLVSKFIIEDGEPGWKYSDDMRKWQFMNYDVMQLNDGGLKKLECYMGVNIHETSVPFDIQRALTKEELTSTIDYCYSDVLNCRRVFYLRYAEFEATYGLVQMINSERLSDGKKQDIRLVGKTNQQLTCILLHGSKPLVDRRLDEFEYELPKNLKLNKYKHIYDWFMDSANRRYHKIVLDKKGKEKRVKNELVVDVAGLEHTFAWGGVHAGKTKFFYICNEDEVILCCDAASFYPSMAILYDKLSRNIPSDCKKKFENIYNQRLEYKQVKDKRQQPLKIVINAVVGLSKQETSPMYDPRRNIEVCVGCEMYLLDLIEHIESAELEKFELINSNTDGIYMIVKKKDVNKIKEIACEWMQRTKFKLEFDEYKAIYQRDVNTYLIIADDGHSKGKGGYLKELTPLDRELEIVNITLKNYMLSGKRLEDSINECTELIKFMQACKVSSKYEYALHGDEKLEEKCHRVFATIDESKGGIFKKKSTGNPQKFANTSNHVEIVNGDVRGMKTPEWLDRQFYIDIAIKRLKSFGVDYK